MCNLTTLSLEISIQLFFFRSMLPNIVYLYLCHHCCNWLMWLIFALLYIVLQSLYRCFDTIPNICQSSSSVFSWYTVYVISRTCIVINFFVIWSLCLSSSIVDFKNDTEYLTRKVPHMFILLMRFLLEWWFRETFSFFWCTHFHFFFFFIPASLMKSASNITEYL